LELHLTSDLLTRVFEHKNHKYKNSFTDKYNLEYCVYYEFLPTIDEAISREKQLKKWRREKKDILISSANPEWKDLWEEIRNQG